MARSKKADEKQATLQLAEGQGVPPHVLKLRKFLQARLFQNSILILIVMNAVSLGVETMPGIGTEYAIPLLRLDTFFLTVFLIELALRIYAYRGQFFRNGWSIFDFVIITISVFGAFSVFRAFRVLRVLHLVTVLPRMRVVVSALIDSIPGIMSVGVVLVLILYVFAVIGSNMFGDDHTDLFGNIFTSMYTLFQVMTLEGWPDVASQVATTDRYSWIYFVAFVMIATFTMLNLLVAIVVRVVEEDSNDLEGALVRENADLRDEIHDVHRDVVQLQEMISGMQREMNTALSDLTVETRKARD